MGQSQICKPVCASVSHYSITSCSAQEHRPFYVSIAYYNMGGLKHLQKVDRLTRDTSEFSSVGQVAGLQDLTFPIMQPITSFDPPCMTNTQIFLTPRHVVYKPKQRRPWWHHWVYFFRLYWQKTGHKLSNADMCGAWVRAFNFDLHEKWHF